MLGPPVEVGVFDFQRNELPKFGASGVCLRRLAVTTRTAARIVVTANATTVLNSLVLHWVASIDGDGEFRTSNEPRRHRSWASGLMLLMDDIFVSAGDAVRIDMAVAQTQWAFAARVLPDSESALEWKRVVILYESQCATVVYDVFWMPPADGAPVRVVGALQPWTNAAGATYPGHQFEARVVGTGEVVARFVAADVLENLFVLACP